MNLKQLSADDSPAFQALRLQALRECPSAFCESDFEFAEHSVDDIAERIRSGATSGSSWILGAFDELGQLLGVIGFARGQVAKNRHRAEIWGMYVLPQARRGGVARILLEALIEKVRDSGEVSQLELSVETNNTAAISLYACLGFQKFGITPRALQISNQFYDLLLMYLPLDKTCEN